MKSEVASGPKRIGRAATVIASRFATQVRPAEKFNCLERWILGYLGKGIQTPMAQGRSAKGMSMIKWIGTIRLPIKNGGLAA